MSLARHLRGKCVATSIQNTYAAPVGRVPIQAAKLGNASCPKARRPLSPSISSVKLPQPSYQSFNVGRRRYLSSSVARPASQSSSLAAPAPHPETHPISALRNISIIAHIDAGKTTLTERLLHLTRSTEEGHNSSAASSKAVPGDVDTGSTVTDFLEQERQRGITIQSAAVGPVWWSSTQSTSTSAPTDPPTKRVPIGITLVDTPGHIDFGIEVERALRVVDGSIVVLDGVEGVESQTENVWSQAARYDVRSSILFINKLDRMGSSVANSIRSVIRSGLHKRPVLLQLPIPGSKDEGGITGVVDLLEMKKLFFSGKAGEVMTQTDLDVRDGPLYEEAVKARHALVEALASVDDLFLEELFSIPTASSDEEPHSGMSASSIKKTIRRQVLQGNILPVLCGSAAKNIGVQPLLDAIGEYLPSPLDKPDVVGIATQEGAAKVPMHMKHQWKKYKELRDKEDTLVEWPISLTNKRTIALAFKVVHDKRKGPITFVRIYSGTLQRTTVLYNTTTGGREKISRVMFPFADQYIDSTCLRAGQIGVILGLRDTRTGDTLVDIAQTFSATPGVNLKTLRLKRVHIPPPVFSMSLEPASKSDEEAVSEALNLLIRTDPSLRLDEGSSESGGSTAGQTVLSGMGELHLEIAKDRLANEFGVNARMGSVRVSYRETLDDSIGTLTKQEVVERDLAGKRIKIGAKITVRAMTEEEEGLGDPAFGGNMVVLELVDKSDDQSEASSNSKNPNYQKKPRAQSKPSSTSSSDASAASGLPPGVDLGALSNTFRSGLAAALSRGPLTSNSLMGLHVTISDVELFGEMSSSAAISYLLSHLLRTVLRSEPKVDPATGSIAGPSVPLTKLMEPMMSTRIILPDVHLGKVISDITAEQDGMVENVIHNVDDQDLSATSTQDAIDSSLVYLPKEEDVQVGSSIAGSKSDAARSIKAEIQAIVPLSKLVRYSSKLRALTAGNAQFSMQLQGFAKVSETRQKEILDELGR